MTNKTGTVLYTGFTNDIQRRVSEHKNEIYPNAFTKKYNVKDLLFFESYSTIKEAKHREFLIKRWKRNWKENLIKTKNPEFVDLAPNGIISADTYGKFNDIQN